MYYAGAIYLTAVSSVESRSEANPANVNSSPKTSSILVVGTSRCAAGNPISTRGVPVDPPIAKSSLNEFVTTVLLLISSSYKSAESPAVPELR